MRRLFLLLLVIGAGAAGVYAYLNRRPAPLVLTGIVTTNDVVVSSQVAGQIRQLLVAEGDAVKKDQLLAVINPEELQAETAYYSHNVAGLTSQVRESEAALRFQERQTADQISQAESTLASIDAQVSAGTAELEQARVTFTRTQDLSRAGVASPQDLDQARAVVSAAQGRVDALKKQAEAQRATIALARSSAEQVAVRRSQVQSSEHLEAAAAAQRTKAGVRLRYAELHAPIDGIVDVRAARMGEVVNPGQPVLTLINPDDLWVRADVEESYVDRIRIGDKLTTHYMDEADKLCDRIAIVDHGDLKALDSPRRLKASIPGLNSVEVSFLSPPEGWAHTLESLPSVEGVTSHDHIFRVATYNGPATTTAVLETAAHAGVAVLSLAVQSTTLDDVFVHYTGRALRDELQEASAKDSPFMMRRG